MSSKHSIIRCLLYSDPRRLVEWLTQCEFVPEMKSAMAELFVANADENRHEENGALIYLMRMAAIHQQFHGDWDKIRREYLRRGPDAIPQSDYMVRLMESIFGKEVSRSDS